MAPIRPKVKSGKGITKQAPLTDPNTKNDDLDSEFRSSKKDKRVIKRSTFMNKIEKSRTKPLKRRRPSKKLAANLDSLADALPDAEDEGTSAANNSQVNIIKHKSLKHKPGAMKRKEKLDKLERDRFAKNMNQLAAGLGASAGASSSSHGNDTNMGGAGAGGGDANGSSRWAALRGFISQTMEHNPEFKSVGPS